MTSQTPPGQWLQSSVQSGLHATKAPPAEPPGHVTPPTSVPSHASPGSIMPLPHSVVVVVDVVVVVEAATVVVVVLVVVVLVMLVVVVEQPLGPQASQQLGFVPMVDGGLQRLGSRLTLQWILPSESVRQQVTAPGLPQVERDAQRTTLPLQVRGSLIASTSAFATPATHFTYAPWVTAVAQLH